MSAVSSTPHRTIEREDTRLATDSLTTHGVIVGMTGSGKTGLGVDLVEEALLAGVPALLVDPKGDLTNLCLTFPDLSPAEFRPWIDESAAKAAGQSPDDFAAAQATAWTDGLAGWKYGTEQIRTLRAGVDFTIYTPGSQAGRPINLVGSLQAPTIDDPEAVSDDIEGYVSGVLGLIGVDADPLSSREHILLSNLVQHAWDVRRRPRPADAGRPGAATTDRAPRGRRPRRVLPGQGSQGARHAAQRPPGLTVVRGVGSRRPARHRGDAAHERRTAAVRDRDDGAPRRRGAPVRHVDPAQQAGDVDPPPERHHRPARPALHGRGARLPAAERDAADEEADHDADEDRSCVRRRGGAQHPEPGRPRLQGDHERRDLDDRPAPGQARQGPPARRHVGRRRRRRPDGAGRHDQRTRQARVRAAPRRQAPDRRSSPPGGRSATCVAR